MKQLIFFFSLAVNLLALGCNDFKDFKKFNNKYYTITVNKLTFTNAKQIAENNNGYLAIPNSQEENDFLQKLIGGNSYAWIGIHDPLLTPNHCYDSSNCANDDSRFKDVKNKILLYKNWNINEPNNLVYPNDVKDGKSLVSPLGEYWVGMFGNNGKWFDMGNHVGVSTIPITYRAIFEFDTKPECFLESDNILTFDTPKCNTQIYDNKTGAVESGTTLECLKDINDKFYCPSALAEASQDWDYDDGFSVTGVGTVTDYTDKENTITTENPQEVLQVRTRTTGYRNTDTGWMDVTTDGTQVGYWDGWAGGDEGGSYLYTYIYLRVNSGKLQVRTRTTGYRNTDTGWMDVTTDGTQVGYWDGWAGGDEGGSYLYTYTYLRVNSGKLQVRTRTTGYRNTDTGWMDVTTDGTQVGYKSGWAGGDEGGSYLYTYTYVRNSIKCPNGGILTNGVCEKIITQCPSGYIESTGEAGECKKTIEYTYYEYQCKDEENSQGFNYSSLTNGGLFTKTDPDPTSNNTDTLDDDFNTSTPPENNCKREKFTCKTAPNREAVFIDNKWQCSPFPCFGGEDIENLDTNVSAKDTNNDGWDENGGCTGEIKIFSGKTMTCRNKDLLAGLLGGGCCNKDKVFLGLIACKADEKLLAKKREKEHTHKIGNFCSKELKLGFAKICFQWSDSYCVFNSKLAQIIQVQGREQLGLNWGSAESPDCSGFSPEDFQRLDFSKIDMSSFVSDIDVDVNNFANIGNFVKDKVNNFLTTQQGSN